MCYRNQFSDIFVLISLCWFHLICTYDFTIFIVGKILWLKMMKMMNYSVVIVYLDLRLVIFLFYTMVYQGLC